MKTLEMLRSRRDEIIKLAESYGATNIRVFGSVARGDDDENSDIDFLVDNIDFVNGSERIDLKFALEDKFRKEVDVVIQKNLKGYRHEVISHEAVML